MIADHVLHLALLGGGFVGHQVLRSTYSLFSKSFNIGFKQGLAARIKAGRKLTPQEEAQVKREVEQKLIEELQKD